MSRGLGKNEKAILDWIQVEGEISEYDVQRCLRKVSATRSEKESFYRAYRNLKKRGLVAGTMQDWEDPLLGLVRKELVVSVVKRDRLRDQSTTLTEKVKELRTKEKSDLCQIISGLQENKCR